MRDKAYTHRAVLVGIEDDNAVSTYTGSLDELAKLAQTAGYKTTGVITQNRHQINPKYLLSKGKLEKLRLLREGSRADGVIFDDDITPSQCRNLEKYLACPVIDRCGLILNIFKKHAKTKEAKVQVELARLNYDFSKLAGKWEHLSRQKGGIGLREVGEKQLEIDRRIIKNKINKLKYKLNSINKERQNQRRLRNSMFGSALVGYTNAGKSTIMNFLSGANLPVEDKLFATLDSTVRVLASRNSDIRDKMLISDTVGFIDKLPHQLIASFKTTLDEIKFANLLIKVVDISVPYFEHQMKIITDTLAELGVNREQSLWVFNKIDLVGNELLNNISKRFKDGVFISAAKSVGMNTLVEKIEKCFKESLIESSVLIGYDRVKIISDIHRLAHIENKEYRNDGIFLTFRISRDNIGFIEKQLNNGSALMTKNLF